MIMKARTEQRKERYQKTNQVGEFIHHVIISYFGDVINNQGVH